MFDSVISINPELGISIKVDQLIFDFYEESLNKNGNLNTFETLKNFIRELKKERQNAIDAIEESEKWMYRGIKHIKDFRPYRDRQEKDDERTKKLLNDYPKLNPEKILDNDIWGSTQLVSMLSYLDENKEYLEGVNAIDLAENRNELYQAILQFDFINVLVERTKDFTQLIVENHFARVEKEDFIRSLEEIEEQKSKKPGPNVPPQLLIDIREILEIILDPEDTLHTEGEAVTEDDLFNTNGRIIIKRLVENYIPYNRTFAKRWIGKNATHRKGGYSDRSLKEHFSNEYKKMKS